MRSYNRGRMAVARTALVLVNGSKNMNWILSSSVDAMRLRSADSSCLLRCDADGVELGDDLAWELKFGCAEVLAQMIDRRCTGDQQYVG